MLLVPIFVDANYLPVTGTVNGFLKHSFILFISEGWFSLTFRIRTHFHSRSIRFLLNTIGREENLVNPFETDSLLYQVDGEMSCVAKVLILFILQT